MLNGRFSFKNMVMMKIRQSDAIALIILLSAVVTAQSPWFRIKVLFVREAAESFSAPPAA
jgi:hypothetical protein